MVLSAPGMFFIVAVANVPGVSGVATSTVLDWLKRCSTEGCSATNGTSSKGPLRRIGLAEAVATGRMFLDEVGDISLAIQVKLPR